MSRGGGDCTEGIARAPEEIAGAGDARLAAKGLQQGYSARSLETEQFRAKYL